MDSSNLTAEKLQPNNLAPPPEHIAKPPFTRAGAYLSRRFYIHPEIADLVAALAGIGSNRRAGQ
jgi:hypothetical protein